MSRLTDAIGKIKFLAIMDLGPYLITIVSFLVTISAVVSLLLIDIYTGQITSEHMSQDSWFGLFISLATTGLIVAAATAVQVTLKREDRLWFWVSVIVFLILQLMDTRMDMASVDIKRFGQVVDLKQMVAIGSITAAEAQMHWLFRLLVGGLSLVGEPLGSVAIVAFPLLKSLLGNVFKNDGGNHDSNQPVRRSAYTPFSGGGSSSRNPGNTPRRPAPQPHNQPRYDPPTYHPVGEEPRHTYNFDPD